MSIVPIAKLTINPEKVFYDFVYNYLRPLTTNITYFITGKYIISDHIMHLVSWNWDFYVPIATDKLGKFYPDQKISPIYNQLMEKILNDIAKSLTLSNFLGYQPIKNNQEFSLKVDFQTKRTTNFWHQDGDGSVFIGLVYLPRRKITNTTKVPKQQVTLVIPQQGYTGPKPWRNYPYFMITPQMQNCLDSIQIFEKDFYSNEIVFINNLTNYHATPCKTNNYLVRFIIKKLNCK